MNGQHCVPLIRPVLLQGNIREFFTAFAANFDDFATLGQPGQITDSSLGISVFLTLLSSN